MSFLSFAKFWYRVIHNHCALVVRISIITLASFISTLALSSLSNIDESLLTRETFKNMRQSNSVLYTQWPKAIKHFWDKSQLGLALVVPLDQGGLLQMRWQTSVYIAWKIVLLIEDAKLIISTSNKKLIEIFEGHKKKKTKWSFSCRCTWTRPSSEL